MAHMDNSKETYAAAVLRVYRREYSIELHPILNWAPREVFLNKDKLYARLRDTLDNTVDTVILECLDSLSWDEAIDLSNIKCNRLTCVSGTHLSGQPVFELDCPRLPANIPDLMILHRGVILQNKTNKAFPSLEHLVVYPDEESWCAIEPGWFPNLKTYHTDITPARVYPSVELYKLSDELYLFKNIPSYYRTSCMIDALKHTPNLKYVFGFDQSQIYGYFELPRLELSAGIKLAQAITDHNWLTFIQLKLSDLYSDPLGDDPSDFDASKGKQVANQIVRRLRMNRRNKVAVLISVVGPDIARVIFSTYNTTPVFSENDSDVVSDKYDEQLAHRKYLTLKGDISAEPNIETE